MSRTLSLLLILFSILFEQGCGLTTTRPKLEMQLAAAAYTAAKNVDSETHSPNLFRKAKEYFDKARSSYRRKYFNKAKQYAILSQRFSEKAEFLALKKQSLEGNGGPTSAE